MHANYNGFIEGNQLFPAELSGTGLASPKTDSHTGRSSCMSSCVADVLASSPTFHDKHHDDGHKAGSLTLSETSHTFGSRER